MLGLVDHGQVGAMDKSFDGIFDFCEFVFLKANTIEAPLALGDLMAVPGSAPRWRRIWFVMSRHVALGLGRRPRIGGKKGLAPVRWVPETRTINTRCSLFHPSSRHLALSRELPECPAAEAEDNYPGVHAEV